MKSKACVRCRQLKKKCNYSRGRLQGCEQCYKLNLACVYDPSFTRSSGRRVVTRRPHDGLREDLAMNISGRVAALEVTEPSVSEEHVPVVSPCLYDKPVDGNFIFSASEVTASFTLYLEEFHKYLPFHVNLHIEPLFARCPLLFWTIVTTVAVAESTVGQNAGRTQALVIKVKALVAERIANPPVRSIEVIQALLILCTWSLPFGTILEDMAHTCSALAIQYAMQIGLHRGQRGREFNSKVEVTGVSPLVRLTTWQACFATHQVTVTRLGLFSFIAPDFDLLLSLDDRETPLTLTLACKLAQCSSSFNNALGNSGTSSTGLLEPYSRIRLMDLYSKQLDDLERLYTPEAVTLFISFLFLATRLELWSYALMDDVIESVYSVDSLIYAEKSYKDSMKLIDLVEGLDIRYCPTNIPRTVTYAALTLIRFLYTQLSSSSIAQKDTIVTYLSRIYHLLAKTGSAEASRARKLIQAYASLGQDARRTKDAVKSRASMNLLFNAIWAVKSWARKSSEDSSLDQIFREFLGEFDEEWSKDFGLVV
jgi:Fungal Zn(2)-Cys(6) binuclear cluster domain